MSWKELEAFRNRGLRPAFPVWLTDDKRWVYKLRGVGYMVIVHTPGEVMPLDLLRGMSVILAMGCDRAARVVQALTNREIECESVMAWCRCTKSLVVAGWSCQQMQDQSRDWGAAKPTPSADSWDPFA